MLAWLLNRLFGIKEPFYKYWIAEPVVPEESIYHFRKIKLRRGKLYASRWGSIVTYPADMVKRGAERIYIASKSGGADLFYSKG